MEKVKNARLLFIMLAITFIFTGCAGYNPRIYKESFSRLEQKADNNLENKKYSQAAIMYRALLDSEPDNKEVNEKVETVFASAPETAHLFNKKKLGSNKTDRVPNKDFGIPGRIALYLPNRILDVLDIFTVEVGAGSGIGLGVKVTEYATAGFQGTFGEGLVGLNRRHLSARGTVDNYAEIGPVEAKSIFESRAYTGGVYSVQHHKSGIKKPEQRLYQQARDFWALGIRAAYIVALNFEIHTVEIYDFFAGLLFFDPLVDDLGSTKGVRLTHSEKELLKEFVQQAGARQRSRGE